jgi:hypothetical protein
LRVRERRVSPICGIAGIIGPGVMGADLKVLEELARVSVVRGLHGAGVLQGKVDYQNKLTWFIKKTGGEMSDLIYREWYTKGGDDNLLSSWMDNFFVCHVRHATKGALSESNAHPFDKKNVVGVHNGTLSHKDYDPKDGRTDSEMMYEDFDKFGIEYTLKALQPDSAFAIVALDKRTKEIVFARNKHRPLSYAWNKHRSVMYFASESQMLRWILDRNDIKYDTIFHLQENYVYRVNPRNVNSGRRPSFRGTDLTKPLNEKILSSTNIEINEKELDIPLPPLIEQQKAKEKGTTTLEATEKTAKSNVVKLSFTQKRRYEVKPREDFHKRCLSCNKTLTLYDQKRSTPISNFGSPTYICDTCLPPGSDRGDWISANYQLISYAEH